MEKRKQTKRLDGPIRRVVRKPTTAKVAPEVSVSAAEVTEVSVAPAVDEPATPVTVPPIEAPADSPAPSNKSVWWKRLRLFNHPHLMRKRAILAVTLCLVMVVGVVGLKIVMASQKIVTKNAGAGAPSLKGAVDPTKLKGEGDGRINILMLGTGGSGHDGSELSDTIMVVSIDPINKTAAMLSIPRDLYVKIPGYGNSKINAANSDGGPELAKEVVSNILDLPIHYYVKADFSGFKQAVDAVGGVDITVASALYDPGYPCEDSYKYCVYRQPAGQAHMDGLTALRYSRCRHDDPASGANCGNDFGRAARQQEVLTALRQKALAASTLTNPVKVAGLIDSVGDHVRTDMQTNEMQKLAKIVKDIDISKATNAVLDDSDKGLLTSSGGARFAGAGSILLPAAGDFDYSQIQELAHSIFIDGYIKKEQATLALQNGTTKDGLGASVQTQLTAYGYNVVSVDTAPEQTHTTTTLIDYTNGKKPYTIKYLEQRFNTKAVKQTKPLDAAGKQSGPDVGIIVGSDYSISSNTPTTVTDTSSNQ